MRYSGKSLKQRQQETGRTLALDGAAWRRLRAVILGERPLCQHCLDRGVVEPATEVDHINNDPTDNRPEALQSLCKPCHSRKTAADHGKRVRYGCDSDGMPSDPSHPWFQKSPATEAAKPTGSPSFNADCLKNRQS